ncbi:Skp1-protein-hydroxyproline N-acetylglucosaminyltransferase [Hondaea fermentalgiana]|uniref:Skp1-protein-hydroxyproline N-acetylglucosaminyltransferase n=1 Tax=Hondaea fermentalgiana TaxID=2315210 RepID=A0A2R5GAB3_9STRA|nr:Skp1-protein-hydroxyproline N-acetylglucosaminyltransferase [Hondaea fermentalgiana]|eukprot:GBG27229.1 Skp1-protein-hydroxyproline N-acetylglucosaminyltransferase [Hondaea fermentalgiana]
MRTRATAVECKALALGVTLLISTSLLMLTEPIRGELPPREKAGWHDTSIVHDQEGWVRVPEQAWGKPHPPYDDRWKSNETTIIVLVAALRESRLAATLQSAFDNADVPARVRFGVVQQNAPNDEDCLAKLCELRGKPLRAVPDGGGFENPNGCVEFDQVRVLRLDASEAAGPVYARGLQPQLLQDEDYCMQIDAHTIFKKGWDRALLREWAATQNEFAVLSTYPTNYKDLDKNSNHHWEMPHICGVQIRSGGFISNKQAGAAANLERPLIAPLWAAGLSFSRCHAERWVPNDKHLRHIFSGEEFHRGARLWTHGYDFYSITRPTIGVYYGNEKGGKGGWYSNSKEHQRSLARLMTALEFKDSDQSPEARARLGEFTLGTRRTIDQYIAFSGVDVRKAVSHDKCIVEYVPWDDAGLEERIRREELELAARYARRKSSASKTSSKSASQMQASKTLSRKSSGTETFPARTGPFRMPPLASFTTDAMQEKMAHPHAVRALSPASFCILGMFTLFCGLRGLFELRRRGMLRDLHFKGRRAQ